jgi:hypothetical protein
MKHIAIVVLSDGETWTTADDCEIMFITEAQLEMLNAGDEPCDLENVPVRIQIDQIVS